MRRRDFFKGVVAASVTAPAVLAQEPAPKVVPASPAPVPPVTTAPGPVPWMRGLLEAKPLPMTALVPDAVAETKITFFHERQAATLHRLCELFQPPYKQNPGAIQAGTPEFLDFLIGVSPADRQHLYTSGLDRLELDAKRKFAKSFADLDPAQADQLIRPWLRTWMADHPPTEPFADFINIAHNDIRTATVNSQAWADAAEAAGKTTPGLDLYWYPVDPDLHREEHPRHA